MSAAIVEQQPRREPHFSSVHPFEGRSIHHHKVEVCIPIKIRQSQASPINLEDPLFLLSAASGDDLRQGRCADIYKECVLNLDRGGGR